MHVRNPQINVFFSKYNIMNDKEKNYDVVIVGGGVVGCSTAYQLKQLNSELKILILEREKEIASHASGKAGGFMVRDWCDGQQTSELQQKSFEQFESLAKKFKKDGFSIDYRNNLNTLQVQLRENNVSKKTDSVPAWLDSSFVSSSTSIAKPCNAAQVHPKKLCQAFIHFSECQVKCLSLVTNVEEQAHNGSPVKVSFRRTDNEEEKCVVSAKQVLICAGPWTSSVMHSIPRVRGAKAVSVVFRVEDEDAIGADAIFLDASQLQRHAHIEAPEIYPRPDNTVYVCGTFDNPPVPHDGRVNADETHVAQLIALANDCCSALRADRVIASQACYLPLAANLMLSRLSRNVFVGAGHSCWGIAQSIATGQALADLMLFDESKRINLQPFSITKQ